MVTTTHRVTITQQHINEAAEQAKKGLPSKTVIIYSDISTKGLQLRVQGKSAFWALKYFKWTRTIGYLYPSDKRPLTAIRNASKLAAGCKEVLDDDPSMLEPFLTKYYAAAKGNVKAAKAEMRPVSETWTLQEALDFVITERTKPNSAEPIGKSSCDDWRRALRRAAAKDIVNKAVSDLTKGECDTIKRKIADSDGHSAARKFINTISAVLKYCLDHASAETGLDHRNMWWTLLKAGQKSKPRTRKPSVDEIVKTLILAEEYLHKPLPGRKDRKRGLRENVYNALWWYCLTAQRSTAGVRLRMVDFFPDPKRPHSGWYLAFWAEGETKNGLAFTLPIPPRASTFMLELFPKAKRVGPSQWAFPSERGSAQNDIHVDRGSAAAVIDRLAAVDTPTRKNPELAKSSVDLLAANGIGYWSPHDIRRTIVDVMEDEGIPAGASAVLAHEVKLSDDMIFDMDQANQAKYLAMRVARVTKLAYGAGQFVALKSQAMEAWTNTILDRYEELSGRATARARKKKNKALSYFLVLDPAFADQIKADADAKFQEHISSYEKAIESAKIRANELAETVGHSHELAQLKHEIESCKISIQQFLANREKYILGFAETNRRSMIADHPGLDFDVELPDYNAAWKEFILGNLPIQDLKREARVAISNVATDGQTPIRG